MVAFGGSKASSVGRLGRSEYTLEQQYYQIVHILHYMVLYSNFLNKGNRIHCLRMFLSALLDDLHLPKQSIKKEKS